jgi:stage IV sporulation protein FB
VCLLGALALLLLPFNWIISAVMAALWHEGCHWLALKLCGCRCYGISVGREGTVLETEFGTPAKEALCALAGPLGSILLLLFFRWIPRIAIFALIQGVYNLIPVYPLDGGRLIRSLLRLMVKNGKYVSIAANVETVTIALLVVASMYCLIVLQLGYLPLIFVSILFYRVFQRKLSCKEVQLAVQ